MANSIDIHVDTLTGKIITLAMKHSDTIAELKTEIFNNSNWIVPGGIHPDQQRLFYDGRQLEDNLTILDYNIQPEFNIQLRFERGVARQRA